MNRENTMSMRFIAAVLTCICMNGVSSSYEIDTHSRITQMAYNLSVLSDPEKQKSFGLLKSRKLSSDGAAKPNVHLGQTYYEVSGNTVTTRTAKRFDEIKVPVGLLFNDPPIERWEYSIFNNQDMGDTQ
jgi:hypothetical protein